MIEVSDRAGVAVLRMADGKANAMTVEFCDQVTARLEEIRLSSARAVVVTGNEGIFSAGVDLLRLLEGGRSYIRNLLPTLSTMLSTVFTHPKPVVAAVNGHAIAGGCLLACAADRRIMVPDAGRIGIPELLVGVAFPAVAIEIVRSVTAPPHFEDLIFGGATYTAAEALVRGVINEVAEPKALLERAFAEAERLAALPASSFALSKRQARAPGLERLERVGRNIDFAVEEIWTAPDTMERVRAYVTRTLKKN